MIKLCDERYLKYRSSYIRTQVGLLKTQLPLIKEGRQATWLKNCIGYMLKNPTAQFIDPQYMPLSGRVDYENLEKNSAITQSVIEMQYAGFPQPAPQESHQLAEELSIIQSNYNKTDLTGQPVTYLPTPLYDIAGDRHPPPPAQKGAMDWLSQGVDLVGGLVSIGSKIFMVCYNITSSSHKMNASPQIPDW